MSGCLVSCLHALLNACSHTPLKRTIDNNGSFLYVIESSSLGRVYCICLTSVLVLVNKSIWFAGNIRQALTFVNLNAPPYSHTGERITFRAFCQKGLALTLLPNPIPNQVVVLPKPNQTATEN